MNYYPSQDLTNQIVSQSYQGVLQKYVDGSTIRILDGLGAEVFNLPSGSNPLTTNDTASIAALAITASFANTASLAKTAIASIYALTASISITKETVTSASWASSSVSSSYIEPGVNVYLSQSYISSVTGSTAPPYQPATMWWDDASKTYAIYSDHPGVTLQLGQEQWLRSYAGENISNGDAVYISGSLLNLPVAMRAIADGTGLRYNVVGIATEEITSGSVGVITTTGQVHDLDTSIYTGSLLYLSPTAAGKLQSDVPVDPYEKVTVGYVVSNNSSSGIIQVNITNAGQNFYPFVGITQLPTVTVDSSSISGSIFTVGEGRVNLCSTADGMGKVINYLLSPSTFEITSSFLDTLFLVATFNSGSPSYQLLSTGRESIDSIQTTTVYTVLNGFGGTLVTSSWDNPGILLANKDYLRVQSLRGVERETGCVLQALTSPNSAYIEISSGSAWHGVNRVDIPSINSSGSRVVLIAHSSSTWSGSLISEAVYNQYDDGSNLLPLGANKFVCNWIYRTDVNTNATLVFLGPTYDKLSDAISSQPPILPTEMTTYSFLTGRIICKNTGTQTTRIQQTDSAYVKSFVPIVTEHNSLLGLDGGTSGEYYHLTAVEYTGSGTGSFVRQTSASINSAIITGSLYGTSSYSLHSISSSYLSSSTATVDVLTVTGLLNANQISGSQIYITSSQLTVTDNILVLNACTPHLRYAGIEVMDSGSTEQFASILWDGENNYFFVSSSDAGYSRKIIMGPDSESDLTVNYIPIATGSNGLVNSIISQTGSSVTINGPLTASNISGTSSYANTASYAIFMDGFIMYCSANSHYFKYTPDVDGSLLIVDLGTSI